MFLRGHAPCARVIDYVVLNVCPLRLGWGRSGLSRASSLWSSLTLGCVGLSSVFKFLIKQHIPGQRLTNSFARFGLESRRNSEACTCVCLNFLLHASSATIILVPSTLNTVTKSSSSYASKWSRKSLHCSYISRPSLMITGSDDVEGCFWKDRSRSVDAERSIVDVSCSSTVAIKFISVENASLTSFICLSLTLCHHPAFLQIREKSYDLDLLQILFLLKFCDLSSLLLQTFLQIKSQNLLQTFSSTAQTHRDTHTHWERSAGAVPFPYKKSEKKGIHLHTKREVQFQEHIKQDIQKQAPNIPLNQKTYHVYRQVYWMKFNRKHYSIGSNGSVFGLRLLNCTY